MIDFNTDEVVRLCWCAAKLSCGLVGVSISFKYSEISGGKPEAMSSLKRR